MLIAGDNSLGFGCQGTSNHMIVIGVLGNDLRNFDRKDFDERFAYQLQDRNHLGRSQPKFLTA